ncbi:hypothetical protein HK405_003474 [Cladochytrium tenue]|nr:hypothetical protein HK405_003474 [Cladochytrium tenue]
MASTTSPLGEVKAIAAAPRTRGGSAPVLHAAATATTAPETPSMHAVSDVSAPPSPQRAAGPLPLLAPLLPPASPRRLIGSRSVPAVPASDTPAAAASDGGAMRNVRDGCKDLLALLSRSAWDLVSVRPAQLLEMLERLDGNMSRVTASSGAAHGHHHQHHPGEEWAQSAGELQALSARLRRDLTAGGSTGGAGSGGDAVVKDMLRVVRAASRLLNASCAADRSPERPPRSAAAAAAGAARLEAVRIGGRAAAAKGPGATEILRAADAAATLAAATAPGSPCVRPKETCRDLGHARASSVDTTRAHWPRSRANSVRSDRHAAPATRLESEATEAASEEEGAAAAVVPANQSTKILVDGDVLSRLTEAVQGVQRELAELKAAAAARSPAAAAPNVRREVRRRLRFRAEGPSSLSSRAPQVVCTRTSTPPTPPQAAPAPASGSESCDTLADAAAAGAESIEAPTKLPAATMKEMLGQTAPLGAVLGRGKDEVESVPGPDSDTATRGAEATIAASVAVAETGLPPPDVDEEGERLRAAVMCTRPLVAPVTAELEPTLAEVRAYAEQLRRDVSLRGVRPPLRPLRAALRRATGVVTAAQGVRARIDGSDSDAGLRAAWKACWEHELRRVVHEQRVLRDAEEACARIETDGVAALEVLVALMGLADAYERRRREAQGKGHDGGGGRGGGGVLRRSTDYAVHAVGSSVDGEVRRSLVAELRAVLERAAAAAGDEDGDGDAAAAASEKRLAALREAEQQRRRVALEDGGTPVDGDDSDGAAAFEAELRAAVDGCARRRERAVLDVERRRGERDREAFLAMFA